MSKPFDLMEVKARLEGALQRRNGMWQAIR